MFSWYFCSVILAFFNKEVRKTGLGYFGRTYAFFNLIAQFIKLFMNLAIILLLKKREEGNFKKFFGHT
jgi:hypothetical protein